MAAALLPFLPAIAGGLLSAIPSIVQMARGKGLRACRVRRGGRIVTVYKPKGVHLLRHKRQRVAKHVYRRHRRAGKGIFGDILGSIPFIGPLIKGATGLGLHKKALMYHGKGISTIVHRPYYGHGISTKVHRAFHPHHGGLLMPAGGRVRAHYTRAHYRRVGRKKVHVKGHKKGGYLRITY